jgi:hypothetical protein
VPDFSAETHRRFRGKLTEITKLVEAGDVAGLKAFPIKPYSSSPKAMADIAIWLSWQSRRVPPDPSDDRHAGWRP